jgi:hypothetical protein
MHNKNSKDTKDNIHKATKEGKLYIETKEFFSITKVQHMIKQMMQSSVYKRIKNDAKKIYDS